MFRVAGWFFTASELKIVMYSCFCLVSNVLMLINVKQKRLKDTFSLQIGNIKQVLKFLNYFGTALLTLYYKISVTFSKH